jgi:hypothetical protein
MLLDVAKILNSNKAILRSQSETFLNLCLDKLQTETELTIDLQNLESMTSAWITFLIVGLEECESLNKITLINVKEDVWQLKIDEAYKLATDKVYRQHVEEIWDKFINCLEDDHYCD